MSRFKYCKKGRLLCKWSPAKDIPLLDCCFTPGDKDDEFIVQCEVEASSEEQAQRLGRDWRLS